MATIMTSIITANDAQQLLDETISKIKPIDGEAMEAAAARMESLLKPPGSLGRLEELAIKLAGIQGVEQPVSSGALCLVYVGDHGVVAEGVSTAPSTVSAIMTRAFCSGKAGINVLARRAGAVLKVIDVGVKTPYQEPENLIVRRVRPGTGNIRIEAAMMRDEALQAIAVGIETARDAMADISAKMVGIGEMGIGNTTAAAALTAAFTGRDAASVTGTGTGVGRKTLRIKTRVVKDALELHKPDRNDPVGTLAKIGGLEIAAMTGAMLAAAAGGAMVLIDGFISGAAALAAAELAPVIRERMVLSHLSIEPGHRVIAAKLELKPVLDMGFHLGEGSGAAAVMPLIDSAAALLREMGTLAEDGVHLEDPS